MISQEELLTRNKIIGVLLRSARLRAGKSEASCAAVLSRDPAFIGQAEEGKVRLTLPQLESLAHHLGVSIAYLMGDEALQEAEPDPETPPYEDIMAIRRKIIGVILRQARLETGRTLDDVAPAMGYTPEYLARVELGEAEISMIELDLLAQTLGIPFDRFVSEDVIPMTVQDRVRLDLQRLEGLPSEVREFVLQPINTPYLQIAMNLSQMPSETLRQIASGLLEITY